jgi:hypothetical protein
VLDWLVKMGLANVAPEDREEEIWRCLLICSFYSSLSDIRSIVRLSKGIAAQSEYRTSLREFLRVLLQDMEVSVDTLREHLKAGAQVALAWGQVVVVDNGSGKVLKLRSKLHEIYFMKELYLADDFKMAFPSGPSVESCSLMLEVMRNRLRSH